MKILIVDDFPKRYAQLIIKLISLGIDRKDIALVSCISDAEEKISHTNFDLLILDILIPYYSDGESDKSNSLDFFYFINHESPHKPKKIIGITSDKEILNEVSEDFLRYTWCVIEYSDIHEEWLEKILAYVTYFITNPVSGSSDYKCSIVILCALKDPELNAILELSFGWQISVVNDSGLCCYIGHISIDGKDIKIAATYCSRMGMVASSILTTQLINIFSPNLIVMTGICAGNVNRAKIGDILLADPAWDYQCGKRYYENNKLVFKIAPHHLNISDKLRRLFIILKDDPQLLSLQKKCEVGTIRPSLRIGPVACSSAVLADGITLSNIQDAQHKDVLGVDMEIYGFYAACSYANYSLSYFAIKSVCDFANHEKNDSFQNIAAEHSAFILNLFLEKFYSHIL